MNSMTQAVLQRSAGQRLTLSWMPWALHAALAHLSKGLVVGRIQDLTNGIHLEMPADTTGENGCCRSQPSAVGIPGGPVGQHEPVRAHADRI